ncbi:MAG TPA: hypothetical protein VF630_16190 [Hymenobacter sp.]|jgi:hypothetical protein
MADEKELSHDELKALYAAALKRIEDLEGEQTESAEIISDLQEQLGNALAGQEITQTVVVTHTTEAGTKEQYKVTMPKFKYKGTAYTASDLSKNADLVAQLVAAESGVLHKLEKAKPAKKEASK